MLQKWLCKKCYNQHRFRPWDEHRKRDKQTGEVYVQKDRTWARGKMYCVALMDCNHRKGVQIRVDGEPPECCYYLLEQTLNQPDV